MKRTITNAGAACAATIGLMAPLHAADIDLFTTTDGNASAPNVYLMIDNSANWTATIGGTSKKEMEQKALEDILIKDDSLTGSGSDVQIRIGLGLFSDGNSPKGGVVYSHVQDFTDSYQDTLADRISKFEPTPSPLKSNNKPYAGSFDEAYHYFGGLSPLAGDDTNNENFPAPDPDAIDSGEYISPAAGNCGKNFVILMSNGQPVENDKEMKERLEARGGSTKQIAIETNDFYEENWSDEYARFMAGADVVPADVDGPGDDDQRGAFEQNVRTYVIDVYDTDAKLKNKEEGARALNKSIAKWGDGRYFAAGNTEEIKKALNTILDEILAVNSVFAASTLPVSVNVRGTNLNQVYMGVFRPSNTNQTRWQGNLKLYKLGVDESTNELELADKNGAAAQNSVTGFIRNDAVSYWTHDSTYWDFDPRGDPKSGSDSPDGPVVEKGAAHQQIRDLYDGVSQTPSARTLYTDTCDQTGGCSLDDFNATNSGLSQDLVDWVHGHNNVTDNTDPDTKTDKEPRPSVHGDVLHSKPAVINYGDQDGDGVPDIHVFYGSNDGIFHGLAGGKDGANGDGDESWGFIPSEFHDRLDDLRQRASGKTYFADGGVGILKQDQDGDGKIEPDAGDKVHIFIGMRRGGRLLYALDVTDPTTPKFLWKASPSRNSKYSDLGQTWSRPAVTQLEYGGSEKDVVIFGGGYDPDAEDPGNSASPSQGQTIYVVDAGTGSVIWKAEHSSMTYPIPSDITRLDSDNDGYVDRLYVGDTGGQVWRADIGGAPDTWDVHRLASVGEAAGKQERKFLFQPDVVLGEDSDDGDEFYAVLLGSGDREAPFKTSVTNRFYMFKDREMGLDVDTSTSNNWPLAEGDLFDATANTIQDGTKTESASAQQKLDDAEGWLLTLEGAGEKVVSSSVTISGTTFFNTNEPPDSQASCGQSLGTARFYEVSYENAIATIENNSIDGLSKPDRMQKAAGGGFPPSPVPVIVEIDGEKYQAVISGTETRKTPGEDLDRRNPKYWFWEAGGPD